MLATSAANCSNIGFTRADEIVNGTMVSLSLYEIFIIIPIVDDFECSIINVYQVFDASGASVGQSQVAGLQGVVQTALTRCVLVPFA